MADGKNIEIKIAATGGDQAANEFKKAADGATQAKEVIEQSTGMGGMLDNSPVRDEAHEKRLTQIADEVDATKLLEAEEAKALEAEIAGMKEKEAAAAEYAEKLGSSEKKADSLDEEVKKIARIQNAQAVSLLAKNVGEIGTKFKEAANGVQEFDPILAASLRDTGEKLETVSRGVSTVAMGFAVGGPLGAGVAGLTVILGELAGAWINAGVEASKADKQNAAAMDAMVGRMGKVVAEKGKLELKEWIKTLGAEEVAIKAENEALERNRELLEATETAKFKLAQAKGKQEITKIDTDDSLTDEEKIKKKAAVRERMEQERLVAEFSKKGRDVTDSEKVAKDKKPKLIDLLMTQRTFPNGKKNPMPN